MMWLYTLTTGLTALTFFLTGLFVYSQNPRRLLYLRCFIFSVSVALWAFGYFVTLLEIPNDFLNLQASRWSHAFGAFVPITYLHFVWVLLNRKPKRKLFFTAYLLSTVIFLVCLTPLVVKTLLPKMGIHYYPEGGLLYPIYASLYLLFPGYAQIETAREIRRVRGKERLRLVYFFTALGLAFAGGISLFLLIFNIPFAPFFSVLIILYPPMMAYSILFHRFMDIEVIIRKSLIFAGLFAVLMMVVTIFITVTQNLIGQYFKIPPAVIRALSVLIAILLYDPTRKLLINLTDRYLFQKKENIKEILNRLSREIITMLDIDEVGKTVLATLEESMRINAGCIIMRNENDSAFRVLDVFGAQGKDLWYSKDDYFIKHLSEIGRVINLENPEEKTNLPAVILGRLQELNAVLAFPLFIHNELTGVLCLGKKKSDEEYTQEELDFFPTVTSQVAIALSNARLYEILKKSQFDFAQQAKMAAIGTLSAGISHEIKNPLNHIRLAVGMLRLNKKHHVYDAMDKPAFESEVFKTLEMIDENVVRANNVIERLSSFAKKPKELKIEPVSLEQAVETAMAFLMREFEYHAISVHKEYSPNLPHVSADRQALEDVFLNILINAHHAMKDGGTLTIKTENLGTEAEVAIGDTGSGISSENLDKIFDPFFTTKDTTRNTDPSSIKGSGLGLFIVREIVKKFGGRITVESQLHKGTTFHLLFPVAKL